MDGASPLRLFFSVIFPLLRPVVITVIVVATVAVYNDFVNPLYFLPGIENATVQLTPFNFQSQFNTRWHLLFADVFWITIPPLIVFLFFQRQIVSGWPQVRSWDDARRPAPPLSSRTACSLGAEQPRLSWQVSAVHPGLVQLGYEIEASRIARLRVRARHDRPAGWRCTGGGACAGGLLRSREVRHYRVRVRDVSAGRAGATGCGSKRASSSPARGPPMRSPSRTIRAAAVSHRHRCSARVRRRHRSRAPAHVTALGVHRCR